MLFDPAKDINKYHQRRELVFIILSGLFVGTLAMLNILGITRLIDLSFSVFGIEIPFTVFVGVLPYPITFLCTDIISELYGKRRATYVVWTGFILNIWVIFILWIGGILPPTPEIQSETGLPVPGSSDYIFYQLRRYTFSATTASMIAYLTAQFVDVHVFHYLKKLSKGKLLWLRNNGSTLTSQLVDSLSVVLITYFFTNAIRIPGDYSATHYLFILIASNYVFKMVAALVDTIPFYISVRRLSVYLNIDPNAEFHEEKPG
ncbi:MAG: queuosine precursor transporter [Bacteroidales bacterium]|nr:queuosine precursor transporter [Bacteroidales bacterium]MBN2818140.1 queuosine precursor transporter [Bacteroidales bacterium]